MLKTKNRAWWSGALVVLALAAGCTPPGPRALLDGKRLLERGQSEAALARLETAASILKTNALAWSYLGLAYQQTGRLTNAIAAYQWALRLDRNLADVHFNLGCALLDFRRPDLAKLELSTFTLLQPRSLDGWLQLGEAQLHLREAAAAERSFREVLKISANNPVALNGLGLVQMQRNRSRDAVQYFSAAARQSPAYPPALRNLAVVSQYLNNRRLALETYREYAALKPRPADADAVLVLTRQLEQELAPPPPAVRAVPQTVVRTNPPKEPPSNHLVAVAPLPATPKLEPVTNQNHAAKPPVAAATPPAPPPPKTNIEVVRLPTQPVLKIAQDVPPVTPTARPPDQAGAPTPVAETRLETPSEKRGFFSRLNPVNWFRGEPKPRLAPTPLPARTPPLSSESAGSSVPPPGGSSAAPPAAAVPFPVAAPVPEAPQVPRYAYHFPARPAPGNRSAAQRAFAQGVQAQRADRPNEALQSYLQATRVDPAFFEAWYNLGLAAYQVRRYPQSLAAYETTLAIDPASTDARYNFARVLRDAGYWLDAANELEKLLATAPDEARARLALGNLYAQRLGERAKARQQYLKFLELQPGSPEGTAIRDWLANHPR